MTDEQIYQVVSREFRLKTSLLTQQYLKIHKPVYTNGALRIDRIDREDENAIIVYLPVQDEYFLFALYIDKVTEEIKWIGTESRNLVSLIVASEALTVEELSKLTLLGYQESWNKGDKVPHRSRVYPSSAIEFYLPVVPDECEDKLNKLLDYLETDKAGISYLGSVAQSRIYILMDFHGGNQLLGGLNLSCEMIKRMHDLNTGVELQLTAWGKRFR